MHDVKCLLARFGHVGWLVTESGAGPRSMARMDKPLGLASPAGAKLMDSMYVGVEGERWRAILCFWLFLGSYVNCAVTL
jgi:hypothetical protein